MNNVRVEEEGKEVDARTISWSDVSLRAHSVVTEGKHLLKPAVSRRYLLNKMTDEEKPIHELSTQISDSTSPRCLGLYLHYVESRMKRWFCRFCLFHRWVDGRQRWLTTSDAWDLARTSLFLAF